MSVVGRYVMCWAVCGWKLRDVLPVVGSYVMCCLWLEVTWCAVCGWKLRDVLGCRWLEVTWCVGMSVVGSYVMCWDFWLTVCGCLWCFEVWNCLWHVTRYCGPNDNSSVSFKRGRQYLMLPAADCTETPVLRLTAYWPGGRRCPACRYAKRVHCAVIRFVG